MSEINVVIPNDRKLAAELDSVRDTFASETFTDLVAAQAALERLGHNSPDSDRYTSYSELKEIVEKASNTLAELQANDTGIINQERLRHLDKLIKRAKEDLPTYNIPFKFKKTTASDEFFRSSAVNTMTEAIRVLDSCLAAIHSEESVVSLLTNITNEQSHTNPTHQLLVKLIEATESEDVLDFKKFVSTPFTPGLLYNTAPLMQLSPKPEYDSDISSALEILIDTTNELNFKHYSSITRDMLSNMMWSLRKLALLYTNISSPNPRQLDDPPQFGSKLQHLPPRRDNDVFGSDQNHSESELEKHENAIALTSDPDNAFDTLVNATWSKYNEWQRLQDQLKTSQTNNEDKKTIEKLEKATKQAENKLSKSITKASVKYNKYLSEITGVTLDSKDPQSLTQILIEKLKPQLREVLNIDSISKASFIDLANANEFLGSCIECFDRLHLITEGRNINEEAIHLIHLEQHSQIYAILANISQLLHQIAPEGNLTEVLQACISEQEHSELQASGLDSKTQEKILDFQDVILELDYLISRTANYVGLELALDAESLFKSVLSSLEKQICEQYGAEDMHCVQTGLYNPSDGKQEELSGYTGTRIPSYMYEAARIAAVQLQAELITEFASSLNSQNPQFLLIDQDQDINEQMLDSHIVFVDLPITCAPDSQFVMEVGLAMPNSRKKVSLPILDKVETCLPAFVTDQLDDQNVFEIDGDKTISFGIKVDQALTHEEREEMQRFVHDWSKLLLKDLGTVVRIERARGNIDTPVRLLTSMELRLGYCDSDGIHPMEIPVEEIEIPVEEEQLAPPSKLRFLKPSFWLNKRKNEPPSA